MNKQKLLSVMTLYGDTCESLSKFLAITPQTFSNKLNEKYRRGFTQPEILMIKQKYNLSANEIDDIFFESKVS